MAHLRLYAHCRWYSRVPRVFARQADEGGPMSPSKLARLQASEARQQKKQKRKAEEGQLQAKRQEMDKAKVRHSGLRTGCMLIGL